MCVWHFATFWPITRNKYILDVIEMYTFLWACVLELRIMIMNKCQPHNTVWSHHQQMIITHQHLRDAVFVHIPAAHGDCVLLAWYQGWKNPLSICIVGFCILQVHAVASDNSMRPKFILSTLFDMYAAVGVVHHTHFDTL